MLSVNLLPLFVTNNKIIDRMAGAMPIINLGGIVEVSWNISLKERTPVTASQTTKITAAVALIFTALINNKKVKITVSKKIMITLSGRFVSILNDLKIFTPNHKRSLKVVGDDLESAALKSQFFTR
jgi:hypothetical protein